MKLSIFSPERRLLEGAEIDSVTLPSGEGQIQVLPGHAAMVGVLETGIFSYHPVGDRDHLGVLTSGFFEIRAEEVYVMAETLQLQGEIDVDQAKKAQREAEEVLKEADLDPHKFKKYQLKLQESLVRQQLAAKEHG